MTHLTPECQVNFFNPDQIRYLVFDVDGTLAAEGKKVELSTVAKLNPICKDRQVLLCTGRALPLIEYIDKMFAQCNIPKLGYLTEHGGQYWDSLGSLSWNEIFPTEYVKELITCLESDAKILFYSVKTGGYTLYCPDTTQLELFASKFEKYNPSLFTKKTTSFEEMCELIRKTPFSVLRTSQACLFPANREYPILLGKEYPQIEMFFNSKHGLWEVFPPQVTKGKMLKRLMNQLSIQPHEVLFCGNEPADRSIFTLDGITSIYVGISTSLQESATWSVQTPQQLLLHLERMLG